VRPTRGAPLALVLAVVLHQLARTTDGGWLALLAAACLALPLAALVLRPRLSDLQVTSEPVRTRVGRTVQQRLTVRNDGTRWSPLLRLTDSTPGLSTTVVAVPALPPGAAVSAVLTRTAAVRGWTSAGVAELVSTAPLGLLRVRRPLAVPGPFAVAPRSVAAGRLAEAGAGSHGSPRPVAGTGTEVLGLRAWRPGDGAPALSARASARHGRPVVLERERDGGTRVVVLCAAAGTGHDWERALEQSCALAEDALRRGDAPLLLASGVPAPARPTLGDVLEWHARLDQAAEVDDRTLAQAVQAAGPGGALVLLAPAGQDVSSVRAACAGARVSSTVLAGGGRA
jgi:uncharacterized protein (DUF58 family)